MYVIYCIPPPKSNLVGEIGGPPLRVLVRLRRSPQVLRIMMTQWQLLTGLVLAAAPATVVAHSSHGGCDTQSKSFDYMLHVQQWPEYARKDIDFFTMHGMWPSRTGSDESSYPCTCTSEPFDPSKLKSLQSDMDKYWPSLEGSNNPFWTHEWTKHGTCAGLKSQVDFFNTTLAWRQLTDVYNTLFKAGIKPGASYSPEDITNAIKNRLGVTALLGCGGGAENSLESVSFCISHDAQSLIECDESVKSGTGGVVSCDLQKDILYSDGGSGPSPGPGPAPGPSPGPGPSPDQCVENEHGPKCSSDADCSKFPHCVRCAHSGYCTDEPAAHGNFSSIFA